MKTCFFDTSGIVKYYVNETGSAWVDSIVVPAARNAIYLARISAVEVVSAVTRRKLTGSLSAANAAIILGDFRQDFAHQFRQVPITRGLIVRAMSLAELHGLRSHDAIQLAAALRVQSKRRRPITLVSADVELNQAALAEGLLVEDPNHHP